MPGRIGPCPDSARQLQAHVGYREVSTDSGLFMTRRSQEFQPTQANQWTQPRREVMPQQVLRGVSTDPKKHHFSPVFYLKGWCGTDSKLVQYSRPFRQVVP